ncbi:MAG: hypothetical protein JXD22_15935 [Sedimentisphaerales bacterium]|nr:hypothetical protein [Sedimentisphaerales bacterium]
MSLIRVFRRHQKKLMVGIVVVIMVAFGLPTVLLRSGCQPDPGADIIASYLDSGGAKREINKRLISQIMDEVQTLSTLGVNELFLQGKLSRVSGLGGLGEYPVLAAHLLIFTDERSSRLGVNLKSLARRTLYQQAMQSGWADDAESMERIRKLIDELTSAAEPRGPIYYLLLREEAKRAGISASPEQVDSLLQACMDSRGWNVSILRKESRRTIKQIKQTISDYLAIILNGDLVTKGSSVSEPELKKVVRDQLEIEKVTGSYVTFRSAMFADLVADPGAEEIEKQFEQYKSKQAGEVNEENPFGFGYMLEDRVQVEYLAVDLGEVSKLVKKKNSALTPIEQEKQVRQFYEVHPEYFSRKIDNPAGDQQRPSYEKVPFDEVADRALEMWEQDLARKMAEKVLTEGRRVSEQVWGEVSRKNLSFAEMGEKAVSYEELAKKLTDKPDNQVEVRYGKSAYLSYADASDYLDFGKASILRRGQPSQSLLELMFTCEPLQGEDARVIGEAPMGYYQEIGPVVAQEPGRGEGGTVYLVRIINVDKEREAVSVKDDGSFGAAENVPAENSESELVERIKEDWKNKQAFELTRKQAEEFAAKAGETGENWVTALLQANKSLKKDPNAPSAMDPLREGSLSQDRQMMMQYRQMAQNNPNMAEYVSSLISRQMQLLRKSMELAQQRSQDGNSGPAVLGVEGNLSCMVFKDLQVTTPSEQEYQRMKPLVAQQLMSRNQGLLALSHYNPDNIEKRFGFKSRNEVQ